MKQSRLRWRRYGSVYTATSRTERLSRRLSVWHVYDTDSWRPSVNIVVQCDRAALDVTAEGPCFDSVEAAKADALRMLAWLEDLLASAISEAGAR